MNVFVALLLAVISLSFAPQALAQTVVAPNDSLNQHIFIFGEIEMLVDSSNSLRFEQIRSQPYVSQFEASSLSTPQALQLNTHHWFRIRIAGDKRIQKRFLLEFFDQTIDEITAYVPAAGGTYREVRVGDKYPFAQRHFRHKNFELPIDVSNDSVQTYYFQVKSSQIADIIIVLRSVDFFVPPSTFPLESSMG